MISRRAIRGVRLFLAFLLAPVLVPVSLNTALDIVIAYFTAYRGLALTDWGNFHLGILLLDAGGMAYIGALLVMLPCVLVALDAGRLKFRTIIAPTAVLSPVFALIIYGALKGRFPFPFAEVTAMLSIFGVIISGLCFYFIGVWKSQERNAEASLLLEDYLPT